MNAEHSAFPLVIKHDKHENFDGLTKLEYFYAAALTGVCMNPILCDQAIKNVQAKFKIPGYDVDISKALAKQAHAIATAAMQQLENADKEGF